MFVRPLPRMPAVLALCVLAACGNDASSSTTNRASGGASDGGGAGHADSGDRAGAAGSSGGTTLGAGGAGLGPGAAGGALSASGGASLAGTSAGGSAGVSSGAGAAGNGAAGNGGSGGTGSPFGCTLVIGVSPTGQWFDSGFLQIVDGSRWESVWVAHHYTNYWADPADSGWNQAFDPYPGPPHTCAQNANLPDRVLFVAVNWSYTTAAEWEVDLSKIVANLRAKYPSLRQIELMTLTRAPGNVVCAAGGSSNETIIPAWVDAAIAATAAKYPNLVVPAPKFEVPKCSDFMQGGLAPQYTDAGAEDVARTLGAYYAAHP